VSPELFVVYVTINGEEIQGTITTYWNVELEMPNEVVLSQNLLNALQITQKEFDQKYSDVTASDPKIDLSPHTHTQNVYILAMKFSQMLMAIKRKVEERVRQIAG
jgi:hypothetical protein